MKIINDTAGEYMDVINSFYELERFDDNSQTDVLFQGYLTSTNTELKEKYNAWQEWYKAQKSIHEDIYKK